ncbi:MAG: NAD(P)H-hydrate dehydratase [Synergistaceae bacterium]|jgi:NAD(P)H-hydrate epimerase|nr:NAD(P)H-hydrate dehydratase [Synergistaceae bacterium]
MRKFYYPSDIRNADTRAIEEFHFSSTELMDSAGKNAAEIIIKRFSNEKKIVILCGPGNNGGDGFVVAKHLLMSKREVCVITAIQLEEYKRDAKKKLEELINLNLNDIVVKASIDIKDEQISEIVCESDLCVDALLGTGTSGSPRKEVLRLIKLIPPRTRVVSLDIPSGIEPFSGEVSNNCIKSEITITFLAPKTGMSLLPARNMCGEIITVDIGISHKELLTAVNCLSSYTRDDLENFIPAVSRDIHKGDRGAVLILGGSMNYRGAPLFSARAALRSGAGLVVLAVPDFMISSTAAILPEAILVPLKTKADMIIPDLVPEALSFWKEKCDVAVFGPGIGRYSSVKELLSWFWNKWEKPLIVDADALSFIERELLPYKSNIIITPHAAEAASILKCSVEEVNNARLNTSLELAKISGVALLKGMDTIISKNKSLGLIREGSPSLAVPGSGDVLNGAIAAFCAKGKDVFESTIAGALLHAVAGANIETKKGITGILAREIADELQSVINI